MYRNALLGALVFGLTAAIAGYVWVALEFPWTVILPAVIGWFVVVRTQFGQRKALTAGAVGGVLFTVVFITAMFIAIADGSDVSLPAWIAPVLAAALAGAAVGALIGKAKGAGVVALYSAVAMSIAVAVAGVARTMQPAAVQQPGVAQSAWVAGVLLVVGLLVGAAAGASVAQVRSQQSGPSA